MVGGAKLVMIGGAMPVMMGGVLPACRWQRVSMWRQTVLDTLTEAVTGRTGTTCLSRSPTALCTQDILYHDALHNIDPAGSRHLIAIRYLCLSVTESMEVRNPGNAQPLYDS